MEKLPLITTNKILKNCAFTGHRELDESFSIEKLKKVVEDLIKKGVKNFYCGMAKGFDLFVAEEIIRQKEKNTQIKLIACVPFYGQEKSYKEEDKKRYVQALKHCDLKMTFCEHYFRGCELVRDRYMAEQADVLVAYLKKKTGGTAYTTKYFQQKNPYKEIIFL